MIIMMMIIVVLMPSDSLIKHQCHHSFVMCQSFCQYVAKTSPRLLTNPGSLSTCTTVRLWNSRTGRKIESQKIYAVQAL